MGYIVIIKWKDLTDGLNEPIKHRVGHWTDTVHGLEGNAVHWIQTVFAERCTHCISQLPLPVCIPVLDLMLQRSISLTQATVT